MAVSAAPSAFRAMATIVGVMLDRWAAHTLPRGVRGVGVVAQGLAPSTFAVVADVARGGGLAFPWGVAVHGSAGERGEHGACVRDDGPLVVNVNVNQGQGEAPFPSSLSTAQYSTICGNPSLMKILPHENTSA